MFSLDSEKNRDYDRSITEKGGGPVEMKSSSNIDGTKRKREVADS